MIDAALFQDTDGQFNPSLVFLVDQVVALYMDGIRMDKRFQHIITLVRYAHFHGTHLSLEGSGRNMRLSIRENIFIRDEIMRG